MVPPVINICDAVEGQGSEEAAQYHVGPLQMLADWILDLDVDRIAGSVP